MSGFTVLVNPAVLEHGKESLAGLHLLERELAEAGRLLPKKAIEDLRQVRIFVEWKSPTSDCAAYHPAAVALGPGDVNPDKKQAIEIGSLTCFVEQVQGPQQTLLVRELALARLDRSLGWASREVVAAHAKAQLSGLYKRIPYASGGMVPSPAMVSPQDFFAETSESLFGRNDYFPFAVDDLARFDLATCQSAERLWAVKDVCNGKAAKAAAAAARKAEKTRKEALKKSSKKGAKKVSHR